MRETTFSSSSILRFRLIRSLLLVSVLCVTTVICVELLFRGAAFFARDRVQEGWLPGTRIRILAVGDSHTYGGSVDPSEAYPAQLQKFLNQESPGVYSVLNIGIPGMNTAQVLNRLPVNLARWQPDILILWCGVNNTWNNAERYTQSWLKWFDGQLLWFRTYKFVRVFFHDRALAADVRREIRDARHLVISKGKTVEVPYSRTIDESSVGEVRTTSDVEDWAVRDFTAMIRMARATGIKVILISYPFGMSRFVVANSAMRRVAEDLDVPLVEGSRALQRVPRERGWTSWLLHPSGAVYGEIARDVAKAVLPLLD